MIGESAKLAWKTHTDKALETTEPDGMTAEEQRLKALGIIGGIFGSLLLF